MALTINNFWGAEIGTFDDVSVGTGPNIDANSVHRGNYAYRMYGTSDCWIAFSPFKTVADAGSGQIIGLWVFRPDNSSAASIRIYEDSVTTNILTIRWNASGVVSAFDSTTAQIGSNTATYVVTRGWNYIEFYFEHSASATVEVYVNGVLQISVTGADCDGGGTLDTLYLQNDASSSYTNFDDIYWMSGASSPDDRLGGSEVFAYEGTASGTSDWTKGALANTTNAGTYSNTQVLPISTSAIAEYTDGTARAGGVDTDITGGNIPLSERMVITLATGNYGLYIAPNDKYLYIGQDSPTGNDYAREYTFLSGKRNDLANLSNTETRTTTNLKTIDWRPDGKAFFQGYYDNYTEYTTSPWSLTSASSNGNINFGTDFTLSNEVKAAYWSPDGTVLIALGGDSAAVDLYHFSASTPWDKSTLTYEGSKSATGVTSTTNDPFDITFSPDGLRFIIAAGVTTANRLIEFICTTPWDFSTGAENTIYQPVYSAGACAVSHDGKYLYTCTLNYLTRITLPAPYTLPGPITGGPMDDDNIDGDSNIRAMKGVWLIARSGGSGSTHYGLLGNTGAAITDANRTQDFDPGTTYAAYEFVTETDVPLSTEYGRIGMEKDDKGQDYLCAAMIFHILHVPDPPYGPGGFVKEPIKPFKHMLVR